MTDGSLLGVELGAPLGPEDGFKDAMAVGRVLGDNVGTEDG